MKSDWGFNHERTGALLCPASLNWSDLEYVVQFNDIHTFSQSEIESKKSCEVVNWQCLETSGPYSSTKATTTTWKIHGMDYFEAPFLSKFVYFQLLHSWGLINSGIQAYLYIAKLSRKGAKGYTIWQCTYPRHDKCNSCFNSLCGYSGILLFYIFRNINCPD